MAEQPEITTGTPAPGIPEPGRAPDAELSILEMVNVLLQQRFAVYTVAFAAFVLAVGLTLLQARTYTAMASFIPQQSEQAMPNVSGLAAQLGVTVPTSAGERSPAFYAELLESREILRSVVQMEYAFEHQGEQYSGDLIELLEVEAETPARRLEKAVKRLDEAVSTSTDLPNIVTVTVVTEYGPLSGQITERLLELLEDYNQRIRQSQVRAERGFVEGRLEEARAELRQAENAMERFLEQNRRFRDSPQLTFEHERLNRQLGFRQQVVSSLVEAYEQARIEEVRETPVVTILEPPVVPAGPDPRGLLRNAVLGLLAGVVLGVIVAFVRAFLAGARHRDAAHYDQYLALKREARNDLGRIWRWVRRRM